MSIPNARRDVRRLKRRREALGHVVMEKVEERRKLAAERRKLVAARKQKQERDPKTDERKADLDREIARLHGEIMAHGDEIETRTQQIADRRKRRTALARKLKAAARRLRRLLRRGGPEKAIKAAIGDNGKGEQPPGSNWGGIVERMIRWTGYSGPVYWCGCAVAWWTLKIGGGEASSRIRRGYAGFIVADAHANTNGLRAVSAPAKGGVATLWDLEHVVMTTGRVSGGLFETCEGNTSAAGSQSNGDSIGAPKWRSLGDADVLAAQDYR